ncbi:hypothetical protein [Campylobacter geochelonis]|uniref:Type I secretion target GGXGXDXXX repeat-containing protein n=1 Tax=Campylobacter geochelonis TaxID=1780362 RepID=A0A128EJ62_9BACT|nr:hypothetical protein [Campylobacter geochelonis]QKF71501.1 hypothetical protein CGEO_1203 [Campylobacter geochelonis]CZE48442.1 type I secretion target GGXGXDXXX repeat-containing protein [Campylobacter geochelonis]
MVRNKIYTLAGDDTITASLGNNYIEAGSGSDTIDLSSTSKSSKNIVYADIKYSKNSNDKDSGNDVIIGGKGQDTIYGGSGSDTYYVDDKDIITDDSDGEGKVYFNNTLLTGGTYDKDKGFYLSGDKTTEYHLNGNTLIVKKDSKALTINNFNKNLEETKGYHYLGIDLIEVDEIVVTISDSSAKEGDSANQSMKFNVSLNRALEKDEKLTLNINNEDIVFKEGESSKEYTYKWNGNKTENEDIEFTVNATVVEDKTSKNIKARDITEGIGKISDDDKDDDPNNPDPETYDPLAIDLNNDGTISLSKLDGTIYFDLDSNNFKEATNWINKDDELIAIDLNNNGI